MTPRSELPPEVTLGDASEDMESAAAPTRGTLAKRRKKRALVAVEPEPSRQAVTVPEAAWLLGCSPNPSTVDLEHTRHT